MGAEAIPGSARSHKSTSINFKATEPNIAKQTVQKPERNSISKKNKTKYQSLTLNHQVFYNLIRLLWAFNVEMWMIKRLLFYYW